MSAPFDPRAWLDSCANAGGHWMHTSIGPTLGYPIPTPRELLDMRNALSEDEAEAVRAHITASAPQMEVQHG